jgi:toxin ParE1/3/4
MGQVLYIEAAKQDLKQIWNYLYSVIQDVTIPNSFLKDLDAKIRSRADFPESGECRDELFQGLRSFHYRGYVIFFIPHSTGITVTQLLHHSRDVSQHFRDVIPESHA